jgi:steroid delta-isomerase-like uncharacterized protein
MNSKELLQNWIDAFQARDLEAVVACYAEDAVNYQIATSAPSVGIVQIHKDTAEFFRGFPNAWSKVENLMSGGGSFLGAFYGSAPTGKSFEIRGCGFFQFKDEKIILQRGYWDKLSWFSQIGLKID